MKKPHASRKIHWNDEQLAVISDALWAGKSHAEVTQLVKEKWNLEVPPQRWTRFWREHCDPDMLKQRDQIAETAEALAQAAQKTPANFAPAAADLLAQKTMRSLLAPDMDAKQVVGLYTLVIKLNDQILRREQLDLERRRVELLEKRAKQAEEAENTTKDTKLTPAERMARYREIFGLAPDEEVSYRPPETTPAQN